MRFAKTLRLNSISVKVLLAYIAGAVLSIILIVVAVGAIAISQGDVLSGADVAALTEDMAQEIKFNDAGVPVGFDDEEEEWIFESLKREAVYRVRDESGQVALSSAAGESIWPTVGEVSLLQRTRFEFEHAGVAMLGATEMIERNGKAWFVQVAVSARFMELMYRAFGLPFTGAGIVLFSLVLLIVFSVCAFVTLKYTLKPLAEISDSAAAISPRSLHARLQTDTAPTEIVPLVESFNRVLARLEQGYRIQQDFLATAAHELKTPLALIRAQIDLMPDSNERGPLLNDVKHMTRQVQQLLLLAEASEGQNYKFAEVDVHDVAKEAVSYLQRMADAADVRLVSVNHADGMQWLADRSALFTLFKNMLENAIQHAPQGTEVRVEIDTTTASVRDFGPGVTQDQLPQLFARFWRGAHRRDHGAGLGLAICQEIARAHGWTLTASNAEPGLRLCLSQT